MDVERFLTELHSELEEIERQIQLLEQLDVRAESEFLGLGPCPRAAEFRADTANTNRAGDRIRWVQ
jgi:hypothetical protein